VALDFDDPLILYVRHGIARNDLPGIPAHRYFAPQSLSPAVLLRKQIVACNNAATGGGE